MYLKRCILAALLVGGLAVFSIPAYSDELAQAGRDIVAKSQGAIVKLEITTITHMTMLGKETTQDGETEVMGSVIDPSGLIVTSRSLINTLDIVNEFMPSQSGINFAMEITGVKIIQSDGVVLPAQMVYRDKDLDLAFFRPQKPPVKPMPFLNLQQAGSPQLLDKVILLSRLGPIASRTIAVDEARIRAVVDKPKKFYIIEMAASFGMAAFAQDGSIIGFVTMRKAAKKENAASTASDQFNKFAALSNISGIANGFLTGIIPAQEIAAIAKKAPMATPEE